MTKIDIHKSICSEMHDLYAAKNADYGNSFAKTRSKFPQAILIRLNDKLSRLEELLPSDRTPCCSNESIDDTLMDLANYCVMELTERRADYIAAETLHTMHGVIPPDMVDMSTVPQNV